MTDELKQTDSSRQPANAAGDSTMETTRGSGSYEVLSPTGYFAWLTIIVVTIGMMVLTSVASKLVAENKVQEASAVDLLPIEMQGKMLVAQQNLRPASENDDDGEAEASKFVVPSELDIGMYEQRLCYIILVNEFNGPQKALEHLKTTDNRVTEADFELTEHQQSLRTTLGTLLDAYSMENFESVQVGAEQKDLLQKKLGWCGDLVLLPTGTPEEEQRVRLISEATATTIWVVVGFVAGFLLIGAGLIIAITLFVLLAVGKLNPKFVNRSTGKNAYIETFAIWMVLFFGLGQIALPLVMSAVGLRNEALNLALMPLVFFASLMVLIWPVLRGIPFSQVRSDIGWKLGNPFTEMASGLVGYIGLLPILFLALMFVSLMMFFFLPAPSPESFTKGASPSHPIQEYVADGGWLMMGLVILTACIAAPIVEETMFRGVLYRHLRDVSDRWRRWASIGFACFLNGLIFASIHPQGILGIPMLMTLAIGFSLVREWRDSLVGPVLMHGVNNFLVTTMLFFML